MCRKWKSRGATEIFNKEAAPRPLAVGKGAQAQQASHQEVQNSMQVATTSENGT